MFRMTNTEWENHGQFIPNDDKYNGWNMTEYQTLKALNSNDISKFFYGYNDYRNAKPPSYLKHFLIPMHDVNIAYDSNAHPFNEDVLLFCHELINLASFALNKVFTILNITDKIGIYNQILGDNPTKSCAVAYYHYPGMYTNNEDITLGNGFSAHKDIGLISVLKQDSGGLEILKSDNINCESNNVTYVGYETNATDKINDDEWELIEYESDKFVVSFSALLEKLTNNQVNSRIHRVNKINHERVTFALFFEPTYVNGNIYTINKDDGTLVKQTTMKSYLKQVIHQIFDADVHE